jgi:hypothetical protein
MQIAGGGCKRRRWEEDDGGSGRSGSGSGSGRNYPIVVYPLIYRSML